MISRWSWVLSADENFAATRMIDELDTPADTISCQVITVPKKKLGNVDWRKLAPGALAVVAGAAADYARTDERELVLTDAVVGRILCT